MNMFASLRAKAPFWLTGQRKTVEVCETLTRDYTHSELDSIRHELRANSEAAASIAEDRGYKLNPRIAAANLK